MIKNIAPVGYGFLLLSLFSCSSNLYHSELASPDFRTDGDRAEWTGKFQIPGDEKFAVAVSNNGNYLYVAISSIHKDFQRQLARNGLTLWLDVKGGKRQNLGVKFDGILPAGRRRDVYRREQNGWTPGDSPFDDLNLFEGDLTLILMDTKAGNSLGPADLLATASSQNDALFIEYQIPLVLLGDKFDRSKKLGLGFDSSFDVPDMRARPSGMDGGMRGGGLRPGAMDGSLMSGGGQRSGGPVATGVGRQDVEVWMKIQLNG